MSEHLNSAAGYYRQALALLPTDAVDDLAVTHHQLGLVYKEAGDLERALYHYNESIRYKEMAGNIYLAGTTRFNIALMFAQNGRLADALLYARAALRDYESYGGRAAEQEEKTRKIIGVIEQAIEESKK